MLHKCICICFELVLRIVLQKWVETIYMKLYYRGKREMMEKRIHMLLKLLSHFKKNTY